MICFELADAVTEGRRKEYMGSVATAPLLIIDDFGMRKLPHTAAEDLLEIIMRRYDVGELAVGDADTRCRSPTIVGLNLSKSSLDLVGADRRVFR
jgi:hypothetical protein